MAKKSLGPAKRFGARYGRTVREKVAKIEIRQRQRQLCPYCRYPRAKRLSVGIWECRKCKTTFTGKAYVLGKVQIKEEVPEKNGAV